MCHTYTRCCIYVIEGPTSGQTYPQTTLVWIIKRPKPHTNHLNLFCLKCSSRLSTPTLDVITILSTISFNVTIGIGNQLHVPYILILPLDLHISKVVQLSVNVKATVNFHMWDTGLFIICTSVVQGYVWPLVGPSVTYIQQRVYVWRVIWSGLYTTQTFHPLTTFKCWAIQLLDNYFYSMVTLTTFIVTITFNNQCDFKGIC